MFSQLQEHSKEELDDVISLQSVSNPLSPNKNNLQRPRGLQDLSNDIERSSSSHDLQIGEDIQTLTLQNKFADLSNSTGLSTEKSLTLPNFSSTAQANESNVLNLETNSLTLDHHHYYEGLNSTPIMVYQVSAASIIPFDSLVTVPLVKPIEDKHDRTVDLLHSTLPQEVYENPTQSISHPLYILPDANKDKGSDAEKMLISHIYSADDPGNMFLDTRHSYSKSEKYEIGRPIAELINTEFNLSANYDTITSTSIMNNLPLSNSFTDNSSTDTDSEVALTLASLGTLKNPEVNSDCNKLQKEWPASSNQKEQENNMFINQAESSKETADLIDMSSPRRDFFPTLVLRSRRRKGTSVPVDGSKILLTENEIEKKSVSGRQKCEKIKLPTKVKSVTCIKSVSPTKDFHFKKPQKPLLKKKLPSEPQKENLLGQLLKASKHCEPASLIPEGVVDDVIPAVGYRIMDMSNLSEMIRMMHRCSNLAAGGPIVVQEQASLREGAVSQLSIICTGCQEGAVCATSNKGEEQSWDINARVEQLTKEFNVEESQVQRMLEILGIFYRPTDANAKNKEDLIDKSIKKRKKKSPKKEKNLECKVCHVKFFGSNHLKSHMRSHDNILHTCPYCQAYFKKAFNLKEHVRKHENVKYECSYCHRLYADRSSLITHINFVHEGKWAAECEICFKKFYKTSSYTEHLRRHTGEKPYSCEICGKRYSWHDSVKKHMQTHSAESKYKCRLCGKWFRWLLGVRQHLLQQHKLKKCDIEAQVVTAVTETLPVGSSLRKKEQRGNLLETTSVFKNGKTSRISEAKRDTSPGDCAILENQEKEELIQGEAKEVFFSDSQNQFSHSTKSDCLMYEAVSVSVEKI